MAVVQLGECFMEIVIEFQMFSLTILLIHFKLIGTRHDQKAVRKVVPTDEFHLKAVIVLPNIK